MKITRLIYLYTILLLVIVVPSCTDLEEEAFDILPSDNYYQDKNTIVAAVTRAYEHGHWLGWSSDSYVLPELSADQMVWTQKGRHGYDDGNWIRIHGHNWTPEQGQVYGAWIGPYQGIGQCNVILKDIKSLDYPSLGLTEEEKLQHIAELRTLRAWFYIFLIDYFRNVPIVEDAITVVGNSSPQEVFAFIEKELKESIADLPKNTRSGRWDQGGAAAILVRLNLNAEKYIGTPKYAEAAQYAQAIIDGTYGSYSLDPDYRGPFRSGVNGYKSPENIFEFPHAKNNLDFGMMYNFTMHYQARYSLDNDWGGWNGIHLTPSRDLEGNLYNHELGMPYESYSDDDLRKQPFVTTSPNGNYEGFFLIGQQHAFNYDQGYGYSDEIIPGTEEWSGKPLVYVDQVGRFSDGASGLAKGSHVATGEENSGVRFIKFPWLPDSRGLFQFNAAPEIRLAEIYYALAETKFKEGKISEAAELLDNVRKRNFPEDKWLSNSYVSNPSMLTENEFVKDLGREFIGERRRRTDLVRWDRFDDEWWDKPQDAKDRTVYPIPARALNANNKLVPNGYE